MKIRKYALLAIGAALPIGALTLGIASSVAQDTQPSTTTTQPTTHPDDMGGLLIIDSFGGRHWPGTSPTPAPMPPDNWFKVQGTNALDYGIVPNTAIPNVTDDQYQSPTKLYQLVARRTIADEKSAIALQAIAGHLAVMASQPPDGFPDFDEKTYLYLNTDVARAVAAGVVQSGALHFLKWGMKEGRRYIYVPPVPTTQPAAVKYKAGDLRAIDPGSPKPPQQMDFTPIRGDPALKFGGY